MALFDGSVEPTEGERKRMENMDGLRKNIKSVEQVSVTKAVKEKRHGELSVPSPSKPDWMKEDPSEQGEEKSTKEEYRDRYSEYWSDEMKAKLDEEDK